MRTIAIFRFKVWLAIFIGMVCFLGMVNVARTFGELVEQGRLLLGTAQGVPGASVSLPLTLTPPASGNIAGAQFDLQFDPSLLQLPEEEGEWVSRGQALPADFSLQVPLVSPGILRVLIIPPVVFPLPILPEGEIAQLNLIISPDAVLGTTLPISFVPGSAKLSDDLGSSIVPEVQDGSVEVSVLPGDSNGDGVIDVADITHLIEVIYRETPAGPGSDGNGDGFVDVADIIGVINQILAS